MRKRFGESLMCLIAATLVPIRADASLFEGEQLDMVANVMSWVVLVAAPVIGIGIFWVLHIMPEKIAERRHHPQAKAIQCLCLLSLVFGGLLWPLAWLWAYSKPVLHKIAYGTDVDKTHGEAHEDDEAIKDIEALSDEAAKLRHRVAELEAQLNDKGKDA
jgi:CBS domain containing-hemolysin-like protein